MTSEISVTRTVNTEESKFKFLKRNYFFYLSEGRINSNF